MSVLDDVRSVTKDLGSQHGVTGPLQQDIADLIQKLPDVAAALHNYAEEVRGHLPDIPPKASPITIEPTFADHQALYEFDANGFSRISVGKEFFKTAPLLASTSLPIDPLEISIVSVLAHELGHYHNRPRDHQKHQDPSKTQNERTYNELRKEGKAIAFT